MNLPTRDELAMSATEKDIASHQGTETPCASYKKTREQARYAYADAMIAARGLIEGHPPVIPMHKFSRDIPGKWVVVSCSEDGLTYKVLSQVLLTYREANAEAQYSVLNHEHVVIVKVGC